MVPGFRPYHHPSNKVLGGPVGSHSGPIGHVHWVEGTDKDGHGEGGVPLFGQMYPPPSPPLTVSYSYTPLMLLLLLGGIGVAIIFKGQTVSLPSPTVQKSQYEESLHCPPIQEQKEKVRDSGSRPLLPLRISDTDEKDLPLLCSENGGPSLVSKYSPNYDGPKAGSLTKSMTEETDKVVQQLFPSPSTPIILVTSFPNENNEDEVPTSPCPSEKEEQETVIQDPLPEEAVSAVTTELKDAIYYNSMIEDSKHINGHDVDNFDLEHTLKPKENVKMDCRLEPVIEITEKIINFGKESQVEEQDYITKIKTFKITKYPKTNTASLSQYGGDALLTVLEVVLLQNAEVWKTNIQLATPQLSFEGANMSRLRITVVESVDEDKSVARTMTMREYIVTISNKIIEDAVKAVRDDCSINNIRHLAETIKKYRPESSEVKSVRQL